MKIDWRSKARTVVRWGTRIPPVLRSLVGIALIVGGVLGAVLPILGVWMVPLGALLIALDIPPLRSRTQRWIERETQE